MRRLGVIFSPYLKNSGMGDNMNRHEILGGKVQLYKRGETWHCSASIGGEQHRKSTKQDSLSQAKDVAEDWYMTLRGKNRFGLIKKREKTFKQAADQFLKEYEMITDGRRSVRWAEGYAHRLAKHLLPFFGELGLSEVTSAKVLEYRVMRAGQTGRKPPKNEKGEYIRPPRPPARSTIHDEIVTIRQVLKTAMRSGWLTGMPDLSEPYRTETKVIRRPWFSKAEYKELYKATGDYAKTAQVNFKWAAEQVHDYVLFMGNTGLRPDEAKHLQFRDVSIIEDGATGETILEIEVRGKRGMGLCKSMPGAVEPFRRLMARAKPIKHGRARDIKVGRLPPPAEITYPQAGDHVFPGDHTKLFNNLLERTKLRSDRDGRMRSAYSLRHSYISMRLLEGADVYQIAKNCRTSIEMIQKHYAAHIANMIDTSAINVRKSRTKENKLIHRMSDGEGGFSAGTGAHPT